MQVVAHPSGIQNKGDDVKSTFSVLCRGLRPVRSSKRTAWVAMYSLRILNRTVSRTPHGLVTSDHFGIT